MNPSREGLGSSRAPFQTHREYQKAIRKFVDEVIVPDAAVNGPRGKGPSPEVNRKMAYVHLLFSTARIINGI